MAWIFIAPFDSPTPMSSLGLASQALFHGYEKRRSDEGVLGVGFSGKSFMAENFKIIKSPSQKSRVLRANQTLAVVSYTLVGPGVPISAS